MIITRLQKVFFPPSRRECQNERSIIQIVFNANWLACLDRYGEELSMDVNTVKKVAVKAVTSLESSLDERPSGVGRVLLAYAPKKIRSYILNGRMRLHDLKVHEEILKDIALVIVKKRRELLDSGSLEDPIERVRIQQLEKEYQLIRTYDTALAFIGEEYNQLEPNEDEELWWNVFEELASRRNEEWRHELFAKSIAINESHPTTISLRTLWEIGLMESKDFTCLSTVLNSSLYIDGLPLIFMDQLEQYANVYAVNEYIDANLAYCVSHLKQAGLLIHCSTDLSTDEPLELNHLSGNDFLEHTLKNREQGAESAIRVEALTPTNIGLEVARLYDPKFTQASDENFNIFKDLISDGEDFSENEMEIFSFSSGGKE